MSKSKILWAALLPFFVFGFANAADVRDASKDGRRMKTLTVVRSSNVNQQSASNKPSTNTNKTSGAYIQATKK